MSGLAGTVEVTNSSDNKAPWYQNNSIRRLFNGEDLDKETLEGAVGTLSVICGLILTVPYSVMSNMSTSMYLYKYNIVSISSYLHPFMFILSHYPSLQHFGTI